MALPNGTLLKKGRYQVQKLLARGGFGFIYLTLDRLTEKSVVLKELIPVLVNDVDVLRRFVREGRTMQRLSHPNIARVEAMFKDYDNHYMVIEYMSGGSLSDRIERGRKLTLRQAAMVTVALCDALIYLHQMGITHCDLNPNNVLFDSEGRPKLVDLGIAHVSDTLVHRAWHTEQDFTMGTIFYMAPEQLDGVRDDPRVDLYALGVMFYEMLAGRHYLDFNLTGTPSVQAENIDRVRHQLPSPIPEIPSEINGIIQRVLAKRPDDRYPDVISFRQELAQALFPYLSVSEGIRLVAPFRSPDQSPSLTSDMTDWPPWVWAVLCAINVVVMIIFALLLLRSL
jgi:serine/threonine protein kinase